MNLASRIRTPLPLEDLVALCAPIKRQWQSEKMENVEGDLKRKQREWFRGGTIAENGSTPIPLSEVITRFLNSLSDNSECIERPRSKGFYSKITLAGRGVMAHRFAWVLFKGPIPEGMRVCHHCDNGFCCNPEHLFLGTDLDNVADKIKKGRMKVGEQISNSKLTPENVYEIRRLVREGLSYLRAADKFGVSGMTIQRIHKRLTWKHI